MERKLTFEGLESETQLECNSNTTSDKTDKTQLLFFGSFYHESDKELSADLVQFRIPAKIQEIRIIPLGATVDLSSGALKQLGATNPSEFTVKFYFGDLQYPSKTVFESIAEIHFNDKACINHEVTKEVITDGVIVVGQYSAITLAIYGYPVPEVINQETDDQGKEQESHLQERFSSAISSLSNEEEKPEACKDDSMECELDTVTNAQLDYSFERDRSPSTTEGEEPTNKKNQSSDSDLSLSFQSSSDHKNAIKLHSESHPLFDIDKNEEITTSETPVDKAVDKAVDEQIIEETEEISDGDVPDEDIEEVADKSLKEPDRFDLESKTQEEGKDTQRISDQESIPGDNYDEDSEPQYLFDEILSDDDLPDYTDDYEMSELEESWSSKFPKPFSVFSDAFRVRGWTSLDEDTGEVSKMAYSVALKETLEEFSVLNFASWNTEKWIEKMEELLPELSFLAKCNHFDNEFVSVVKFWILKGVDFSLAFDSEKLPLKIRHLKAGLKLSLSMAKAGGNWINFLLEIQFPSCLSTDLVEVDNVVSMYQNACDGFPILVNIFHKLIDIIKFPHMNISTKILSFANMDALLSSRRSLNEFLSQNSPLNESPYQRLIAFSLDSKHFSSRMSFAFRSLLKRVNLGIKLKELENTDGSKHYFSLEQIYDCCKNMDKYFAQPPIFLPARVMVSHPFSTQDERDFQKKVFIQMLTEWNFLSKCRDIWEHSSNSYERHIIVEMLKTIGGWNVGLRYLCQQESNCTDLLKKILEAEDIIVDQQTVCKINILAASLQISMKLDCLKVKNILHENFEDAIASFQTLHGFLNSGSGRQALINVFCAGQNFLPCLLQYFKSQIGCDSVKKMELDIAKGYCVDVLNYLIRTSDDVTYLKSCLKELQEIFSNANEEDEGYAKIKGLEAYILPLIECNGLSDEEELEHLCGIIKNKLDALENPDVTVAPELVTSLRTLCEKTGGMNSACETGIINYSIEPVMKEIKEDIFLVKLHFLELHSKVLCLLANFLRKYSRNGLCILPHELMGSKGDALLSVIFPAVVIVRRILSHLISVRDSDFKDTSAIPILLELYALMYNFPMNSTSKWKSDLVQQEIVNILLAHTIPSMPIGSESEEELSRSTWSNVASEVIKFSLMKPITFLPGASLLSELLPLPLPIPSVSELSRAHVNQAIRLRKLWCAYLHGLSPSIQELVINFSRTRNNRLSIYFRRICIQLADLSPSTCLVICRALLDSVIYSIEEIRGGPNALQPETTGELDNSSASIETSSAIGIQTEKCSIDTAKQLKMLASLVATSSTIKTGVLHCLSGGSKLDEKYADFLTLLAAVLSFNDVSEDSNSSLLRSREYIISFFQSLCDVEISMLTPDYGKMSNSPDEELILKASLPSKNQLSLICGAVLRCLGDVCTSSKSEKSLFMTLAPMTEEIFRTIEVMNETDYGFSILKSSLKSVPGLIGDIIMLLITDVKRIGIESNEWIDVYWQLTISIVIGLYSLINTEKYSQSGPLRRNKIYQVSELLALLRNDSSEVESKSIILQLKQILTQFLTCRSSIKENFPDIEIEKNISILTKLAELTGDIDAVSEEPQEDLLDNVGNPMVCLKDAFASRPVSVTLDDLSFNLFSNECFWMTTFPSDLEIDFESTDSPLDETEMVMCDIVGVCNKYLGGCDPVKELESLFKENDRTIPEKSTSGKEEPKATEQKITKSEVPSLLYKAVFASSRGGMGRSFGRGSSASSGRGGFDPFRSRPPNTSRPPSLHVDDFEALGQNNQSQQYKTNSRNPMEPYSGRGKPLLGKSLYPHPHPNFGDASRGIPHPLGHFPAPNYFMNDSPHMRNKMMRGRGIRLFQDKNHWVNEKLFHESHRGHHSDRFKNRPPFSLGRSGMPSAHRSSFREAPPSDEKSSLGFQASGPAPWWRDKHKSFNR